MSIISPLRIIALLSALLGTATAEDAPAKPNILLILADDCTYSDLSFHGGENAKTPHLDALARQSTVFERAYVGMAICSPCRSELFTGRMPLRNGCAWNHANVRPGTRGLPQHLAALGYRVGISGKVDVRPAEAFPFETVPGFDDNCVRDPTRPHDLAGVKKFMTRDAAQPFCLVVALTEPHAPWVMGDAAAYPPRQLKLPPYLADTPVTRQDFGRYLAEVTYMDSQVGDLLAAVDGASLAPNTLVVFSSEQGAQFPGAKWTNWDSGMHTSILARWPGVVPAGRRTAALVQYADVLPTFIEVAGGQPDPAVFDGSSFAAVLRGSSERHRDFVFGMHNNYPEGPPYPIRSISDGDWHYIRNLSPERLYFEKHLMGRTEHNPYWLTWIFNSTENPRTRQLVERFLRRPAEELYHTAEDRFEMTNLAADPAQAETKARLVAALDRSLADQLDPGVALDTPEASKASERNEPVFPGKP